MRDFQIQVEIQATPDQVWTVMRDVEHWSDWTPTVRSIRRLDHGPLVVGSRAIVRQPKLPPAMWRITELDDTRRTFTWISRAPGVRVIACHSVNASGAGSRATLSLRFEGLLAGLLARLTRDINDQYLALEAKGLKQHSERSV
jgi:hypothetical protein